jgi:hypothetical protein
LHAVVHAVQRLFGVRLYEATGGGGRVRLLTDGREIYARTETGEFFNLLDTPPQPLLAIGEDGLLKELGASMRTRRRTRTQERKKSATE